MPTVIVAAGEIYYEAVGNGHPVIFISGFGGAARSWYRQVAPFSEYFKVITYDHRGTGASDRIQRSFSIDGMSQEVVGLMDALGIERAHLVGMSTGGTIAQTIAVTHPERLARMILCSAWTHCDAWNRRHLEARRAMILHAGVELHGKFQSLWLYPPDWINAHDKEIEEEQQRLIANAPPVEVMARRLDALFDFDRRADLGRISAPVLVVAADNDAITPPYFATELARDIPGARLHVMRGGGHAFTRTRAEEFNRLALAFLRNLNEP